MDFNFSTREEGSKWFYSEVVRQIQDENLSLMHIYISRSHLTTDGKKFTSVPTLEKFLVEAMDIRSDFISAIGYDPNGDLIRILFNMDKLRGHVLNFSKTLKEDDKRLRKEELYEGNDEG